MKYLFGKHDLPVVFSLYLGIFFLILLPVFWVRPGEMAGFDIRKFQYPFDYFTNSTLKSGQIPFWNPHLLNGMPFLETPRIHPYYPPNWSLFLFPGNATYMVYALLHLAIGAAAMYWLISRVLTAGDRQAAIFAGFSFALSGFFASRLYMGHILSLATMAYVPVAVGKLIILLRSRFFNIRQLIAVVFFLSVMIFTGYQIMSVYIFIGLVIVAAWHAFDQKNLWPVFLTLIVIIFSLGITAVSTVPSRAFVAQTMRSDQMDYAWLSRGSMSVKYLLEAFVPFVWGDQASFFPDFEWYHERGVYTGVVTVILAAGAVISGLLQRKKPLVTLALGSVAVFAVWVSLGPHARQLDLNRLLYTVIPVYRFIRVPARHMILYTIAVTALSGIGFSLIRNRVIRMALLLISVTELTLFFRHFALTAPLSEVTEDRQLVNILTDGKPGRILVNYDTTAPEALSFDPNRMLSLGLFGSNGYETAQLGRYATFLDLVNGDEIPSFLINDNAAPKIKNFTSPFLDTLGIRYLIVPGADPGPDERAGFAVIYENPEQGIRLYENPDPLPLYFFVPEGIAYPGEEALKEAIRTEAFDPKHAVGFTGSAGKKSPGCQEEKAQVNIREYRSDRVTVEIEAPCDGFLVSSDVMYPSWRAYVDGQETEILYGNLAFRTVAISTGSQVVEYRYVPRMFFTGAAISLATVFALAVLTVLPSRLPIRQLIRGSSIF